MLHSQVQPVQLPHEQLTGRQKECLYLLLQGFSAKMIAQKLGLSSRTIETHIEGIKNRLGCFRKSEIIEYGFKYIGQNKYFYPILHDGKITEI